MGCAKVFDMTPEQATFLLHEVYLPQIRLEHKTTRRVIEAIPADKTGWKPDDKAKTSFELASHLAASECFFMHGVASGKFDRSAAAIPESVKTPEDLLKWYDENHEKAVTALATAKGDHLTQPINFVGVFNFPAINYTALMISHSAHHRGQLSSYLRPMGSKVPRIYGGSADEPMEIPAQAS
jgi:uncharacterized damage-inducible protein DinB